MDGFMYRLIRIQMAIAACQLLLAAHSGGAWAAERVIRVGIVGCDTSHVLAFTKIINRPEATGPAAEVEITAAYPGGSPDLAASRDRLAGYVAQLRDQNVAIVDSLDALVEQCDAFLLESVDGRVHREQFQAIARGKPVFTDKPAAASLADVVAIFRLAEKTGTPVFSSSALRYCDAVQSLAKDEKLGPLLGCEAASPLKIEPTHPSLFWYGVHGVESLFTILGTGCETVVSTDTDMSTVVTGKWRDGRCGVYRGLKHDKSLYAFVAFGTNDVAFRSGFSGYEPAVDEICKFLVSGKPPVRREDTIEIFAFMEAADESQRQGGRPVAIRDIIARAEEDADKD